MIKVSELEISQKEEFGIRLFELAEGKPHTYDRDWETFEFYI